MRAFGETDCPEGRFDMFLIPVCKLRGKERTGIRIKICDRNRDLFHNGTVVLHFHGCRKASERRLIAGSQLLFQRLP